MLLPRRGRKDNAMNVFIVVGMEDGDIDSIHAFTSEDDAIMECIRQMEWVLDEQEAVEDGEIARQIKDLIASGDSFEAIALFNENSTIDKVFIFQEEVVINEMNLG